MAGKYSIAVNGTFVLPTRRPDLNQPVVAGNLAQCKSIISYNSTVFPGQFPMAAIDSSNGTAWQPSVPDPAFIVVDLDSPQSMSGVHINWGDAPARSFEVKVSNDSTTFTSVANSSVEISAPFNETEAAMVMLTLGNITDLQFSAMGRYFWF